MCLFSGWHSPATADRIGEILLWELPSGKLLQKMSAPAMYTWDEVQRLRSIGGIRSLAFSTDQQTLAVGGMGHVQNVDGLGEKPAWSGLTCNRESPPDCLKVTATRAWWKACNTILPSLT